MLYRALFVIAAVCMFLAGCSDNTPVIGPYPTVGIASWYSVEQTSAGTMMGHQELTCAIRKTEFGRRYKVCNLTNSRCVIVVHNDFGPSMSMFRRGRIVDLSQEAFSQIADLNDGIISVSLEELP